MTELSDFIAGQLRHLSEPDAKGCLATLDGFGSNPGALAAKTFIPERLGRGAPLVVVLHGCTQTAEGYNRGSGWSDFAERHGVALLFPEQQRQNNPNLCFNWFAPADMRRDRGEALSIRQMIGHVVDSHALDPRRIFVTGLSAGGAMTLVMLATYPELFAGGAVIAGLPYGTAKGVPQALERMRGESLPDAAALAALVRGASPHSGPWPRLSVWHGLSDQTVVPANAEAIVAQWRALHGLGAEPGRTERIAGHERQVWLDAQGTPALEHYRIAGLGHGTPLGLDDEEAIGAAGPHMLEAGICSTRHIGAFFGLAPMPAEARRTARPARKAASIAAAELPRRAHRPRAEAEPEPHAGAGLGAHIRTTIERALRDAGLMR